MPGPIPTATPTPTKPPLNTLCLAAFVTSIFGSLFLPGIGGAAAIALGIFGLRKIKQSGESGQGFAISAMTIGAVSIMLILVFGGLFVFGFITALPEVLYTMP